jgi:hypothetical protein
VLGSDPVIGETARCGFLEVYRFLKAEAGFSADDAAEFMAKGMLINTLFGIRMTDKYPTDADARELLAAVLHEKLDFMLDVSASPADAI